MQYHESVMDQVKSNHVARKQRDLIRQLLFVLYLCSLAEYIHM